MAGQFWQGRPGHIASIENKAGPCRLSARYGTAALGCVDNAAGTLALGCASGPMTPTQLAWPHEYLGPEPRSTCAADASDAASCGKAVTEAADARIESRRDLRRRNLLLLPRLASQARAVRGARTSRPPFRDVQMPGCRHRLRVVHSHPQGNPPPRPRRTTTHGRVPRSPAARLGRRVRLRARGLSWGDGQESILIFPVARRSGRVCSRSKQSAAACP